MLHMQYRRLLKESENLSLYETLHFARAMFTLLKGVEEASMGESAVIK